MKLRVVALAALLCASSAVSAKKYIPPNPIAQQLPVELTITQQEIAIDTPDNSALASQFGLVGALVGMAVSNEQAKTAEKRAAEVRNLLIDYKFNERFEAAIRAKIATDGISLSPQITVRDTPWDSYSANTQAELQKAKAAGNAPPTGVLLLIAPHYALSYNLQNMYLSMNVQLVNRSVKPNGKFKDKWLWWRRYTFDFPLDPGHGTKADTNVRRWNAIGSAEMQRKLDLAVEQVTDMLVYDFSPEGRAEGLRKVGRKELGKFKDLTTFGRQLRSGEDWYWVRTGKGYLMSIRGVQPLKGDAPWVVEGAPAAAPAGTSIDASPAPATAPAAAETGAK